MARRGRRCREGWVSILLRLRSRLERPPAADATSCGSAPVDGDVASSGANGTDVRTIHRVTASAGFPQARDPWRGGGARLGIRAGRAGRRLRERAHARRCPSAGCMGSRPASGETMAKACVPSAPRRPFARRSTARSPFPGRERFPLGVFVGPSADARRMLAAPGPSLSSGAGSKAA